MDFSHKVNRFCKKILHVANALLEDKYYVALMLPHLINS